jgi:hypothetical protein
MRAPRRAWPVAGVFTLLALAACDAHEASQAAADAATTDAPEEVAIDAAAGNAPVIDADASVPAPAPYPRPSYQRLSETGLYADPAAQVVASGLARFHPAHVLWSDGADKDRLVFLPPGTRIDTSDMDHWVFPIGTKLWKQFARGGQRLETRLIERYGPGPEDYWMGSFVWTPDQQDAVFAPDGAANVNGTDHDAPAAKVCLSCHRGDRGRVLGLSAIQLSHAGDDLTLAALAAGGHLSHPPPPGVDYPVPGDATTAAALGYLHANCGHCHNQAGTSWPDTQVVMRLRVGERDPATSELVQTLVGHPLNYFRHPTLRVRVAPGDPAASAVIFRMKARGDRDQMPPLATKHPDPVGIELLTRWIAGLPR